MPRREGDVFLLGTAMSVSSRGVVGASSEAGRLQRFWRKLMPIRPRL
jgi:hypothetical protein